MPDFYMGSGEPNLGPHTFSETFYTSSHLPDSDLGLVILLHPHPKGWDHMYHSAVY